MYSPPLTQYHLGARLYQFPRPSWQILFIESEKFGMASILPTWAANIYPLSQDAVRPGFYSSPDNERSFRHLGTTVNTFLDGHAEALAPGNQLDQITRYTFQQ